MKKVLLNLNFKTMSYDNSGQNRRQDCVCKIKNNDKKQRKANMSGNNKNLIIASAACVSIVSTLYVLRTRYLLGLEEIYETASRKRILQSDGVRMCSGIHFRCDVCHEQIKENENRYTCWDCDENQETYDLCQKCYPLHPQNHNLKKCKHSTLEISESQSSAERLVSIFDQYEERKCFGIRKKILNQVSSEKGEINTEDNQSNNIQEYTYGKYEWISYGEVGSRAKAISAYLRRHKSALNIVDKPYFGICGKNSVDWYCSDYAICFAGIYNFCSFLRNIPD